MKKRIDVIDAARGLAVVLMVIHHALFDVSEFLGGPAWLYWNPVFAVLHYIFAGLFIFLAGVSSRFSRSNLKRGLITALAAAVVTAVSYFVGEPIKFGVLHLLAACMLGYGLLRLAHRPRSAGETSPQRQRGQPPSPPLRGGDVAAATEGSTLIAPASRGRRRRSDRGGSPHRPRSAGETSPQRQRGQPPSPPLRGGDVAAAAEGATPIVPARRGRRRRSDRGGLVPPLLCAVLIVVSALLTRGTVTATWLFPLGFCPPGFYSADYFPLLPWVFVFAAGVWAGAYIKARRLPDRFYDARVPLLPKIGRRSFIIYLLHQPILYGITMLILKFR